MGSCELELDHSRVPKPRRPQRNPKFVVGVLHLFGDVVLEDIQAMVGKLGTTELVFINPPPKLPVALLQSGAENSCPYTPIPHLCKAIKSWQMAG